MVSTKEGNLLVEGDMDAEEKKKSINSLTSHMVEESLVLVNNVPALSMCGQESMDIRNLVQRCP